jgi:dCTP deaminase
VSILSDRDIERWMSTAGLEYGGDSPLVIRPMGFDALQPASVDLRLGPVIKIAEADGGYREHHLIDQGPYLLARGVFVLAATLEHVEIPKGLVGILVGKSSRAREGFAIEDAGYVDPGWRGELTMELDNRSPAPRWLMHGMYICQIRFETLETPSRLLYAGRYQNSTGPVESRAVVGRPS